MIYVLLFSIPVSSILNIKELTFGDINIKSMKMHTDKGTEKEIEIILLYERYCIFRK
jgi:hypothetical protein